MNNSILVDGQNILKHRDGIIKLENLEILRDWAKKNKISMKIVLPGYRGYKERIPDDQDIIYINSHVYDDSALIQLASNLNLPILSNDRFREYRRLYPEYDFEAKVFSFDIILGLLITSAVDYFRSIHEEEPNMIGAFSSISY